MSNSIARIDLGGIKSKGKTAIVDSKYIFEISKHNWTYTEYGDHARGPIKQRISTTIIMDSTGKRNGKDLKVLVMELEGHKIERGKHFIKHLNGDALDNRAENLDFTTRSEIRFAGRIQKNNSSGYRGVSWNKKLKKWIASIHVYGWDGINRQKYLGSYYSEINAARAYNRELAKIDYIDEEEKHYNIIH